MDTRHPPGTLVISSRERTRIRCWFKKYGCDGKLEVVTKFAGGSRVDDRQSVCSSCGVQYLGDPKRASEAEPTISLKVNWLNHHRDLMIKAENKKWWRRLLRRYLQ